MWSRILPFVVVASLFWLVVALVPISALFSAVALAAAAFARSSKEGQYYLVPLMMISMSLMIIPMLPAAKLDFGTSLIPVTDLMLLLRSLIEGHYAQTLQFFAPVCCVTIVCCWVAVRWVVHQFNNEAVQFADVLFPTLIMAMMLTTNAWKTLKLSRCSIPVACAAAIMAIYFHPALMALTSLVMAIYP